MAPLVKMTSVHDDDADHRHHRQDVRSKSRLRPPTAVLRRSTSLDSLPVATKSNRISQAQPSRGLKRVKSSDACLKAMAKSATINANWEKPAAAAGKKATKPTPAQTVDLKQPPPKVIDYTVPDAKRATVRFSEEVRMRSIRHIDDYPPDVIKACWITEEEMDEIREKVQLLVDLVDKYPDMIEELGGLYGLEKHTKALKIQRKGIQKRSVQTVLDIQSLQLDKVSLQTRTRQRFNPDDFGAKMYFLQSAKNVMDARVFAVELHDEVSEY
jgi:hypothetical protein